MGPQIFDWLNHRSQAARHAAVGALALAALAACNGNEGTGTASMSPDFSAAVLDMSPPPPDLIVIDLKDSTYPAGPYAQSGSPNIGGVLPDFTFQGYWSPGSTTGKSDTTLFGEVTFGMLHTSGARYAIINLSAFW